MNFELIKRVSPKPSGVVSEKGLTPLLKGSLIHACIDAAAERKDWFKTFNEMLALPEYSAIEQLKPNQSGSRHHLHELLGKYMRKYTLPDDIDFKFLHSEVKLSKPMLPWLTAVGTLDKIGLRPDGSQVIIDHKTSTQLSRFLEPSVAISDQFSLYTILARANGYAIENFIVDGICTDKTAYDKDENLFVRYETSRSEERLKDFETNFIKIAERIKFALESDSFIPNRGKACNDFGKKCAFYDICAAQSAEIQLNIINNSFTSKPESATFKVIWEP